MLVSRMGIMDGQTMTLQQAWSAFPRFGSAQSLEAKRLVELGGELAAVRCRFEMEFDIDLENAPDSSDWSEEQIRDEIARLERLMAGNREQLPGSLRWVFSMPRPQLEKFVRKFNKWPNGSPEEE